MSLHNISIALASVVVLASATAFAQDASIIQNSVPTNTNMTKSMDVQLIYNAASTIMRILLFISGVFTRKILSSISGSFLFNRTLEIQSGQNFNYFVAEIV
jgi:hypothetical protein